MNVTRTSTIEEARDAAIVLQHVLETLGQDDADRLNGEINAATRCNYYLEDLVRLSGIVGEPK